MDENPYSAPRSHPEHTASQSGAAVRGPYGFFRNNTPLMGIVIALLIIDIIMSLFINGFLGSLKLSELEAQGYQLAEDLTKVDQIIMTTTLIRAAVGILLTVLFCIWINRASKNAWLLDAPHMRTTPGWAVGYHFIPILNLWKPYMAMKEIRRASFGNDHKLGKLLPLWWTFWVLSMIIGNIIGLLAWSAKSNDDHIMTTKMGFIELPIYVILCGLAIALVLNITRAQNQRYNQWRP